MSTADGVFSEATQALMYAARDVRLADITDKSQIFADRARALGDLVNEGLLSPQTVDERLWDVARSNGLAGERGSSEEQFVHSIIRDALLPPVAFDRTEAPALLDLITPASWRGTTAEPLRWLALNRIPAGDVTILSSDGGGGKTTIALQLCVAVERGLGDWLGTTVETGPVLFVSAEEDDHEIRRRIERICRGRGIDPHAGDRLHLHFPDLESSLFASAGKGPLLFTDLHRSFVATVDRLRPVLVVIDAVAAVFGGDHRDRAQVRAFMSSFRKLAMRTGAAIVFLDHPSVSGMAEGSGRAGSVDWNNTVRSRLYMSSVADDNDARELEVKKANRGPKGEKIPVRWVDGAFVVEGAATPIERQAAEAAIDDLFLRLLEKRNAQGRHVGPKPGRNYAPAEFGKDPEANQHDAA